MSIKPQHFTHDTSVFLTLVLALSVIASGFCVSLLSYVSVVKIAKLVFLSAIVWTISSDFSELTVDGMTLLMHASILSLDYVCLSLEHLFLLVRRIWVFVKDVVEHVSLSLFRAFSLLSSSRDLPAIALEHVVHFVCKTAFFATLDALVNVLVFIEAKVFRGPKPTTVNRRMRRIIDRLRAKGLWRPALTSVVLKVPMVHLPQRVDFRATDKVAIPLRYLTYWAIEHSRVTNLHVGECMAKKKRVVLHSAHMSDKRAQEELKNEWLTLLKLRADGGPIWHQSLVERFTEGDETKLAMVNCVSVFDLADAHDACGRRSVRGVPSTPISKTWAVSCAACTRRSSWLKPYVFFLLVPALSRKLTCWSRWSPSKLCTSVASSILKSLARTYS